MFTKVSPSVTALRPKYTTQSSNCHACALHMMHPVALPMYHFFTMFQIFKEWSKIEVSVLSADGTVHIGCNVILCYFVYFMFYILSSEYKLGVTVYRCLHGRARRYLADHLIPASDAAPRRRRLRSANLNRLTVPRCRLSTYGCRAVYYAGPTVWNTLPDELRNSDSFDSFKRFLKTILFSRY